MLGTVHHPKTKSELAQAITRSKVQSIAVYEGNDLNRLPSKSDLIRSRSTVVVLKGV